MNPVDLYRKVLAQVVITPPSGPVADHRKSILDLTLAETQALQARLGKNDKRKLGDYLTSLRAMEMRLGQGPGAVPASCSTPGAPSPALDNSDPDGSQTDFAGRVKAMFDVVTFAFKCDLTRSVAVSFDGDNVNRRIQGVPASLMYMGADIRDAGTHSLSHFENASEGIGEGRNKCITRDRFYLSRIFHHVDQLKQATDASGSPLLDNTVIDAGYSVRDGNHSDGQEAGVPRIVSGGRNFMKPGNAYDCSGNDRRDFLYTLSARLGMSLPDFKGSTKVMNI